MSETDRDRERVETRADLLPEEKAAGSEDPEAQAEAILADSDERTAAHDSADPADDGPDLPTPA
ncbi:hypothetical protein G7072_03505 [Nocardioides sp. HDW12B]|uniref:hypothetical protein n=1 Tax=Nocardioides sp. HDW12B TaxID=2714939 RepID=UPI0014075E99|nr:hypothetical protein [Nocardioides sp. HDW12B]QIK65531.1 hypothetical protein G7072_03505 [Nocardioides sp. HDW12B]